MAEPISTSSLHKIVPFSTIFPSESTISRNEYGAFTGATSKPPPQAQILPVNFFTEKTSGTPVVRVAQQRCGRSRRQALLRCCASQPMADNYALATEKRTT